MRDTRKKDRNQRAKNHRKQDTAAQLKKKFIR